MLFTNPRKWTHGAVGTWWRFLLVAIFTVGLTIYAPYVAAESGLKSGLAAALMPIMFQLMFLYALRRMYRQAVGTEGAKGAA